MRINLLLDRDFFSKPCIWKETASQQVAHFNRRQGKLKLRKEYRLDGRGTHTSQSRPKEVRAKPHRSTAQSAAKIAYPRAAFEFLSHSSARQVSNDEPSFAL
jgi:hypothetical protein